MYDVAIIGAGVVGAMTARTLSLYGISICILEKAGDVAAGASKANSAIVHAGFDAHEGSLKAKLNVRGSQMMQRVAEELGVKYRRNGSLVIGFDDADRKTIEELYVRGVANGVSDLSVISGEDVRRLEPNISKNVTCALYAASGAIICPYELTIAAVGNAMDNGADLIRNFEVTSISSGDGEYEIFSGERSVKAHYVVNCAGLYSDKISSMVAESYFTVHPRRGEYLLLDRECGNTVSCTVFNTPSAMGKGILVTPTVDGNLLLGPTSEDINDKDNKETTSRGLDDVITRAVKNVDGIPAGKVITSFCGLRAVGNTGDFIIDSPAPRFVNAAGIESPGLSSAPAIAEYIRDMLSDMGLELNRKPNFNPYRKPMDFFARMTQNEKNDLIRRDRTFGHIICRCETVTEGEIIYAIRTNPGAVDVDGVKRRTRSGMGRCQGGFCMPGVIKILARECGKEYTDITKFGGKSGIVFSKTKGRD